jgi:glycogen debranching enzyme
LGQPYLHELLCSIAAPAMTLSPTDGQLRGDSAAGLYVQDLRVLSTFTLTLDGTEPVPLTANSPTAQENRFVAVVRHLGDPGPDPTVLLHRTRRTVDSGLHEEVTVRSYARDHVYTRVSIALGADYADMTEIKSGRHGRPATPTVRPNQGLLRFADPSGPNTTVHLRGPGPFTYSGGSVSWEVAIPPHGEWRLEALVAAEIAHRTAVVLPAARERVRPKLEVRTDRPDFDRLFQRSLVDLDALQLRDPAAVDDVFYAAGAPWYLTLFGRDSLWAARMALPVAPAVAAGTLRTLARRQGAQLHAGRAEEPGKVLHEIRATGPGASAAADRVGLGNGLPPVYYGTVDATTLWINLLHEAWLWGMAADEVQALLPALLRALGWIVDHGMDASGFVTYFNASPGGLRNQGWKDSEDGIQFSDGTPATGPVALCEAQAYAVQALRAGAALLDAFGVKSERDWRAAGDELAERFRRHFWVEDMPAIALDGAGRPVDTLTSNIGHLLGTGLLDPTEEHRVAALLADPQLDSGYGIRTLSESAAGYNPVSYHAGSVWTHDTAIAIRGLAAARNPLAARAAGRYIRGLVDASRHFGYRLPELFGGQSAEEGPPVPYPASCRPQAWAAAAGPAMLAAMLGIAVDHPNRSITVRPLRPSPVGRISVSGLPIGRGTLAITVDADGTVQAIDGPAGFRMTA